MNLLLAIPLEIRAAILFLLGAFVGGQLNRGIYRLAWYRRSIGPWSPPHDQAPPRNWADRIPIVGWFFLRREAALHGAGFWIRPLLIELFTAIGFAALYLWQMRGGLVPDVSGLPLPDAATLHALYLTHLVLICLMIVATFIDFDEKTIPDEITVPGTLLGLALAAVLPNSRLPIVEFPLSLSQAPTVTPLLLTSPLSWPSWLDEWGGLAIGLACLGGWCFAILPKTWTLRRGVSKALEYLVVSIFRHPVWQTVLCIAIAGWLAMAAVWWFDGAAWHSLLSALVGMAFGGGLIWAVRIIGSGALGKEAMGFGDVTLMAMIGSYLGWQPALMIFFLAPFAALFISIAQWALTGRKDIAFGPYLCVATLVMILGWSPIWHDRAQDIFSLGWYIPAVVGVCLVLMAAMLWLIARFRLF